MHGIRRHLSAPRSPQQNGVVERKNRTILDVTSIVLIEGNILNIYQSEAISTTVYTFNGVHIKGDTGKTSYELQFGHVPTVKYFKVFGRKCYIKRDEDIGNFDARSDECIFLRYSTKSKTYQCYNKRLRKIVESACVRVYENLGKEIRAYDEGQHIFLAPIQLEGPKQNNLVETKTINLDVVAVGDDVQEYDNQKTLRYVRLNHSENHIIGDKNKGVMTRRRLVVEEVCLISKIEPKDVVEACKDENWIRAIEEELEHIKKNNTWELVSRPKDKYVIGTKWVFRNKLNEVGEVVGNKSRLVCKGYSQQEEIDYEETFPLVARIEVVRLLLAYVAYKDFKVYQMDVKSTFLNGDLEEEAYSEQLDGFSL